MVDKVRGFEAKVLRIIQAKENGISRVELRAFLDSSPNVVGKVIGNLLYRELIIEKEGILYGK